MPEVDSTPVVVPGCEPPSIPSWVAVLVLTAFGAALFVPALNWGLPATVSWSQDTIAGTRTLGAVEGWPRRWQGRYPPLHYLLLRAVYHPVLKSWEDSGELTIDPATRAIDLAAPQVPKMGTLLLLAGAVSVVMGIGTGIGIWAFAYEVTGSSAAGLLSAIALMVGADFTYFAHVGCVDVPSVFWFAWSAYFYARCLRTRSWIDAGLLGLLGALAISTKDSVAGVYPGMALVLIVNEMRRATASAQGIRGWINAFLQPRWLPGLVLFVIPYLAINGAFSNWDGYVARMKYWLGFVPDTAHAREQRYADQWTLLMATFRYFAGAVGWAMLAAMVGAVGFGVWRRRGLALIVLAPVLSYYLVVIVPTGFVYARFLFPAIALLCVLVGEAGVTLWSRKPARTLAVAVSLLVLVPSLGYALAIDAELTTDSRYDAEAWFLANVPLETPVGGLFGGPNPRPIPQYLPRLHDFGYATYPVIVAEGVFDRPQPDYLVLSSFDLEDFEGDQRRVVERLLAGELGYSLALRFDSRFLGSGKSLLGIAGWGAPVTGKISPTIWILRRSESVPPAKPQE